MGLTKPHLVNTDYDFYVIDCNVSLIFCCQVIFGMMFGMKVDVWSIGCVLAELFIGQPLFLGENKPALVSKVCTVGGQL